MNVADTIPPQVDADEITIEICDAGEQAVELQLPAVSDACDAAPRLEAEVIAIDGRPLAVSVPVVNGTASAPPGTWLVRWRAHDASGNSNSVTQTVHVLARPALQATEALDLSDRVVVLSHSGGPGAIVNRGSGQLSVGSRATVGPISAAGGVWLRDSSIVEGAVRLGGRLERQNGVQIHGEVFEGVVPPFGVLPTAPDFTAGAEPVLLDGTSVRTLPPGAYADVILHSTSRLRLGDGTYSFARFEVEPGTVVELLGSPTVVVRDGLMARGRLEHSGSQRIALAYGGTNSLFLATRFGASIFAPQASVVVESGPPGVFYGEITARRVTLPPDLVVSHSSALCP